MRKRTIILFLVLILILTPSLIAQTAIKKNSAAMKAAENITAQQLSDYLYFIADDAMQGRDTPSPGLDATANFIAFNLKKWGFKPAGDNGSFFQKIALRRETIDKENTLVQINGQKLSFGEDFIRYSGNAVTDLSAAVVFVGNGWMIKSKNLNPYEGLDVKGKWVAAYSEGDPNQYSIFPFPNGVTDTDLKGERGKDWADAVTFAQQNGAAGVIILPSRYWGDRWDAVIKYYGGNKTYMEKFAPAASGGQIPVYLASVGMTKSLFAGEVGNPLDGTVKKSLELSADKKINLKVRINPETVWTQNIVAIWEGSDSILKNEIVSLGAHYDHLGTEPNSKSDDKIFNGADDNGSGTTALLSIAEALSKSKMRPKRSTLFVWHCGEEKGLWGSRYFTNYPTVDLKSVIVNLNIDMIGRSRKADDNSEQNKDLTLTNGVYVAGSKVMSSALEKTVREVNDSYLKLNYDFRFDDLDNDPLRVFFRSDHFNYAKKGIPVAFWFDGIHEDYHGAKDEAVRIDYQKLEKITRTIFLTMWELSGAKSRPAIDKQLPPELQR